MPAFIRVNVFILIPPWPGKVIVHFWLAEPNFVNIFDSAKFIWLV
jgi:hypothetical protein